MKLIKMTVMVIILWAVIIVGGFAILDNIFLPKSDTALTDRQVLEKAHLCHKEGMAIQLVYDDEWNVYAVKCVYGGFTGDGRLKK